MIEEAIKPRLASVAMVQALSGLSRISEKQTDAVLWQRDIPKDVQNWLDSFSSARWSNNRYILKTDDIAPCIYQHFEASGVPASRGLDWLVQDVDALASELSRLFSVGKVRLRIERVVTDACRLFHADNVKARLICTYSGPGTEYGAAPAGQTPEDVFRAPTSCPMLFKGLKWYDDEDVALKHRSPPIEKTGEQRFVIVVEPVMADCDSMNATYAEFG